MTKITSSNPEVVNYGIEKYSQGYEDGYTRSNTDRRIRVQSKKKFRDSRFEKLLHYFNVLKD